jgi:5-methylcytosine-specific restriction protein B
VRWTHNGKWKNPGNVNRKALTDITTYADYVKRLKTLLFVTEDRDDALEIQRQRYSEAEFLSEVYMSAESYAALKGLLQHKKNIILQGAPGVGKTFTARRLAYSIMGEKDESRVAFVQFHPSYSYEDFIMGYRPNETGFRLENGPFYEFCKRAGKDKERDYFFIIDEINRGNLGKIFGEALMLIENDKRGEEYSVHLLYGIAKKENEKEKTQTRKDEENSPFYVPPNVYIIGMMNTADRSLALIDYALRRRFSFFDMEPAFQSKGFKAYEEKIVNENFKRLIEAVEELNKEISEELGKGFQIGHSYFCIDLEKGEVMDDARLLEIIDYELAPLLEEYWFDAPDKDVEKRANKLRNAINDKQH